MARSTALADGTISDLTKCGSVSSEWYALDALASELLYKGHSSRARRHLIPAENTIEFLVSLNLFSPHEYRTDLTVIAEAEYPAGPSCIQRAGITRSDPRHGAYHSRILSRTSTLIQ